jgi:hypothetical protein
MALAGDLTEHLDLTGISDPQAGGRHERLDQISVRARAAEPGEAALTAIAGVLYGAAWLAAKIFGALFLAAAWTWAAVALGWKNGRGKGPSRSDLVEDNLAMRAALERMGGDQPSMTATREAVRRAKGR